MTRLGYLWVIGFALLMPLRGWGLSSDRDQPMTIEADRVELDDAKGISTYHGNVKVTQGSLVLTGDLMTVHSDGNDVQKVIMLGNPATYRQRPDGKDEDVRAKSQRMEYYVAPERVILLKQAEVVQQGDVLRSERIEYDVASDQVNAGTSRPDDRVRITIQPRNRKDSKPPATP
jgi:lipopolysaccharide export system protein LptA